MARNAGFPRTLLNFQMGYREMDFPLIQAALHRATAGAVTDFCKVRMVSRSSRRIDEEQETITTQSADVLQRSDARAEKHRLPCHVRGCRGQRRIRHTIGIEIQSHSSLTENIAQQSGLLSGGRFAMKQPRRIEFQTIHSW